MQVLQKIHKFSVLKAEKDCITVISFLVIGQKICHNGPWSFCLTYLLICFDISYNIDSNTGAD